MSSQQTAGFVVLALGLAALMVSARLDRVINLWVMPDGDTAGARQITSENAAVDGLSGIAWTPDGSGIPIEERPDPKPEPGHVVIEVKAFGLNHAEIYFRKGVWGDVAEISVGHQQRQGIVGMDRQDDIVNGTGPPPGGRGGPGHGPFELQAVTDYLGLTAAELRAQLQAGKTLALAGSTEEAQF